MYKIVRPLDERPDRLFRSIFQEEDDMIFLLGAEVTASDIKGTIRADDGKRYPKGCHGYESRAIAMGKFERFRSIAPDKSYTVIECEVRNIVATGMQVCSLGLKKEKDFKQVEADIIVAQTVTPTRVLASTEGRRF